MDPIRSRRRRRLAITTLALLAAPLLAEGVLRWLLFSPSELAARLGKNYRNAALFFYEADGEEGSALQYLITPLEQRWSPAVAHPDLGWLPSTIDPSTLRHREEQELGERTPILFYGASYAACLNMPTCFEDLLERDESGSRFRLLNYAATAYGIDQALLLLGRTVELYADAEPVVVLALTAETDLHRTLNSFYNAPKPRFEKQGAGYVVVPPEELDATAFLARRSRATSYLARYAVHGLQLLPEGARRALDGVERRGEERLALVRHLLASTKADLTARGLHFFVLLFHTDGWYSKWAWRHEEAEAFRVLLDEQGIAYVDSRVEVERALERGERLKQLYLADGHPSERGTKLLFQSLERGLEQRFDNRAPPQR